MVALKSCRAFFSVIQHSPCQKGHDSGIIKFNKLTLVAITMAGEWQVVHVEFR
jgi:hypothetical protein